VDLCRLCVCCKFQPNLSCTTDKNALVECAPKQLFLNIGCRFVTDWYGLHPDYFRSVVIYVKPTIVATKYTVMAD